MSPKDGGRPRRPNMSAQAGVHDVEVRVQDAALARDTQAFSVTVAAEAVFAIGESRNVTVNQANSATWHTVSFQRAYVDPVVVMGPLSFNGSNPSTVRVRNVTSTGFEFQIDEWDYLDGAHISETVGYLVVEAGAHTLEDGSRLVAGKAPVSQAWQVINLPLLSSSPVILTQVSSTAEASAVTTRTRNVTNANFEVRLQEEQASDGIHAAEQVGFVAWEPGTSTQGNLTYQVARTADSVTHAQTSVSFQPTFSSKPVFLAAMQTFDGSDPAGLRATSVTTSAATFFVEEEASADSEIEHTTEVVGYVALMDGLINSYGNSPPNADQPNVFPDGDELAQAMRPRESRDGHTRFAGRRAERGISLPVAGAPTLPSESHVENDATFGGRVSCDETMVAISEKCPIFSVFWFFS